MSSDCTQKKKIMNRLSRMEGQIRGVRKMISEEQPCQDIVKQMSAVHSALEGATKLILVNHFTECLRESRSKGSDETEALEEMTELLLNTRF